MSQIWNHIVEQICRALAVPALRNGVPSNQGSRYRPHLSPSVCYSTCVSPTNTNTSSSRRKFYLLPHKMSSSNRKPHLATEHDPSLDGGSRGTRHGRQNSSGSVFILQVKVRRMTWLAADVSKESCRRLIQLKQQMFTTAWLFTHSTFGGAIHFQIHVSSNI